MFDGIARVDDPVCTLWRRLALEVAAAVSRLDGRRDVRPGLPVALLPGAALMTVVDTCARG